MNNITGLLIIISSENNKHIGSYWDDKSSLYLFAGSTATADANTTVLVEGYVDLLSKMIVNVETM